MQISEIKIGGRRPVGDILQLIESIKEIGLINPVTVDKQNNLLAGGHRVAAFKAMGFDEIPANIICYTGLKARLIEIDENLIRNELSALENADQLAERKRIYETLYPESLRKNKVKKNLKQFADNEIISPSEPTFTADTAEKTGKSQRTIQQAVKVSEGIPKDIKDDIKNLESINKVTELQALAKEKPEQQKKIVEKVKAGKAKTVTQAKREVKKDEVSEKIKEIPADKYVVFYADPPWSYNDKQGGSISDSYGAAEKHYPCMSMSELETMEIQKFKAENSVLFLWATSPLLPDALALCKVWGFKYKSAFIWDKIKHNMGHYNSVRHELLLIATHGSCTPQNVKLFDSVQSIERGKHSEKPEQFREIIDTLYPDGKRLELFRRGESIGDWVMWGNEVE